MQSAFGFGGEIVNTPPKIFLLIILLGCFLRILHKKKTLKFSGLEKAMFVCFGLFIVCGSISSLMSNYSVALYPQIMDVFNYSSFILAFYGTICYYQDLSKETIESWLKPSEFFIAGLTIATFFFWFVEQTYGIGMTSHDVANRIFPPYEFIYYHGTYLITIIAFSFLFLYDKHKVYTFILCFLCLISARDRGYLFLLLFLSFCVLLKFNKFNLKFLFPIITLIGCSALAISYQKILFYTDADSIRATFYVVAVLLALKFNPFGAGWCTIGTWNAYRYNSPIFNDFYYYFIWADNTESVYGDSGFSSVIGQTGFLGTIFYTLFMALLFFVMLQKFRFNQKLRIVVCAWVLFLAISFFVSDSMVSNFAIISGFFVAILYLRDKCQYEESLEKQKKGGDSPPHIENSDGQG